MPTWEVEDGSGLATATSLCSVADADDHFSTHPLGTTLWPDSLGDDGKKAKLMQASLIASRRLRWRGWPVSSTQAFPVPASGLYDYLGRLQSSSAVPADVARGIAELAGIVGRNGVIEAENPGVKSQTTGPNSVEYAGAAGGRDINGIPARVIQYLEPYIFTEPMMARA